MNGVRLRVPVRALTLLVVLALGLSACGGDEAAVPDDGTQGLPLAGLGDVIDEAGVDVLSADTPAGATADQVETALTDAGVTPVTVTRAGDAASDALGFDPTATAGLLTLVDDGPGSLVVLVFSGPDAAAVFAAGDPEVFTDGALEAGREELLAGNLVGYVAAEARPDRLREALGSLAGTASESPTESSTGSPTGSPSATSSPTS